jgi:dipeptidyl aminopeptidase/acylaminoacyl peptidase
MKLLVGLVMGLGVGLGVMWFVRSPKVENKVEVKTEVKRPLEKYTIENLGKREYESEIILDQPSPEASAGAASFWVQKFHFDSDGKNVTGLGHFPKTCEKCPVIVQFRGYAPDPATYYQGYGTQHSAEIFAANGFISLAPDFLGYGGSASSSADVFESRFETYTTALNLLAAVKTWDKSNGKIGVWGHSNGGQIALTTAEISQHTYPMVLWAPVTAGFPYSILFYMNDNEEGDKQLRNKLHEFENLYDTSQFNLLNYLDRIQAKVQLHQGSDDVSVPIGWSRNLVKKIKDMKYYEYPGADHNLVPDWSVVVKRDIEFFRNKFNND